MIIVATVALSTMISNDLIMPVLLRAPFLRLASEADLPRLILMVRRLAHPAPAAAGLRCSSGGVGEYLPAGQHRPDLVLRRRPVRPVDRGRPLLEAGQSRPAPCSACCGGVGVWLYTLVLPTLAGAGLIDGGFVAGRPVRPGAAAPAGAVRARRPGCRQPCGALEPGAEPHARPALRPARAPEQCRAVAGGAVRRCRRARRHGRPVARRGQGGGPARPADPVPGRRSCRSVFAADLRRRGTVLAPDAPADATLVQLAERQLARAIGSASARVMIGSVVRGEVIGPDDLMRILDETSQVDRVQQAPGAEVGSAGARHRRAARRQRAAAAARPAQGRFPGHGQPRAAHAR